MENEETFITDFELKEDVVNSYSNNSDIKFDDLNVKKKIEAAKNGTLLVVQKKIGSFITILSAQELTEQMLKSAFK